MDKITELLDAVGWCWCIKRKTSLPGINKKVPVYWVMGPRYCGKTALAEELSVKIKYHLITVPHLQKYSTETAIEFIIKSMAPYKHTAKGFLIDGFPSNLAQARHFMREIYEPRLIIFITLTEKEFTERIKYARKDREEENKLLEDFRYSTILLNQVYRRFETKTLKLLSNAPPDELAKRIVLYLETYYGFLFDE